MKNCLRSLSVAILLLTAMALNAQTRDLNFTTRPLVKASA